MQQLLTFNSIAQASNKSTATETATIPDTFLREIILAPLRSQVQARQVGAVSQAHPEALKHGRYNIGIVFAKGPHIHIHKYITYYIYTRLYAYDMIAYRISVCIESMTFGFIALDGQTHA